MVRDDMKGRAATSTMGAVCLRPSTLVVGLLFLLLYVWMALACAPDKTELVVPADSRIPASLQADLYNLQAAGFLKGHLWLDLAPHPELVSASNPYDPATRPAVPRLHDASLYQGHYYSYFGPAPALLLFAPWNLVTGRELGAPAAVCLSVSLALLALFGLYSAWCAEFHPNAGRLVHLACLLALGGLSLYLPLLRRAAAYEVAISFASCCFFWAMLLAWLSTRSARPGALLVCAGLLLGLAVCSRPTFILVAPIVLVFLLLRAPAGPLYARVSAARLVYAVVPFLVLVGLLCFYNWLRFDSPLEFGQRYQLSGIDEGAARHFSLSFVPTQIWCYLFSPLAFSPAFPFVSVSALTERPPGYWDWEYSFGLFTNLPFLWLALAAPSLGWACRRGSRIVPLALAGLLFLVALAPLLLFFGSCVRYMAEFTPALVLLACCCAHELDTRLVRYRHGFGAGVLLASAFSCLLVFLVTIDMYNPGTGLPPPAFDSPGRMLNRLVRPFTGLGASETGPLLLRHGGGEEGGLAPGLLVETRPKSGEGERLSIERDALGALMLLYERAGAPEFTRRVRLETPAASDFTLQVSLPTLYPARPSDLPRYLDRADFGLLKTRVQVRLDGILVLEAPVPWPSVHAGEFVLGGSDTHRVVARAPVTPLEVARMSRGGSRLSFSLQEAWAGRSLPLVVTGRTGAGNFLFLRVESGSRVRLGYDHWGKANLFSPVIQLDSRTRHVLEVRMPSMASEETVIPLEVTLDGRLVWRESVPFFRTDGRSFFLLENPLGGSSCERVFPESKVEATGL